MDLFTQPVVGWRLWKVGPEARRLASVFMAYEWPLEVAEAKHLYVPGPWPGMASKTRPAPGDCGVCPAPAKQCGFNAYSSLEEAIVKNPHPTNNWQCCHVMGAISGFGKVILHEKGFRCSKARVLCLIEDPPGKFIDPVKDQPHMTEGLWLDRTRKVAENYEIPLLPADLAGEFVANEGARVDDYLPADD